MLHSYGLDVVSRHHASPSSFDPSFPPWTTKNRCATNATTCAYLCPGPGPRTTTRCHRGAPCRSRTWRSSDASPAGPMPPWTTIMLPTAAAECAARGDGPSPEASILVQLPDRTSKECTSDVAPARPARRERMEGRIGRDAGGEDARRRTRSLRRRRAKGSSSARAATRAGDGRGRRARTPRGRAGWKARARSTESREIARRREKTRARDFISRGAGRRGHAAREDARIPLVLPFGPSPSSAVAPPKTIRRCPPPSAGTHVSV